MAKSKKESAEERETERYVVGISGASGAIYAKRFVEALIRDPNRSIDLTYTSAGLRVLNDELGARAAGRGKSTGAGKNAILRYFELTAEQKRRIRVHPPQDIGAGPASGTYPSRAMIVIPGSMNTLGMIANGLQPNLLTRAAAVTLKEGRPLVLVPRETPLGLIELRNMVAVTEAGAIVLPANPGFYQGPESIEDLVQFIVQKIMDRLGLETSDPVRWGISEK